MESSDSLTIIIYLSSFIFLLLLSMFFSACETAFMSASGLKIRYLSEKNHRKAKRVHRLLQNKDNFLSAILIGNNIVNILTSSIVTALFIQLFGSIGVGIATAFVTISILIFGEILPKSLALKNPEHLSFHLSLPLKIIMYCLYPIVIITSGLTKIITFPFRKKSPQKSSTVTEEDLKMYIEIGEEEGSLLKDEKTMLENIFKFSNLYVKDIMTPRIKIIGLPFSSSINDVLETSFNTSFSRFPIWENSIDNIKGFIYTKDLLFLDDRESLNIKDFLRPVHFTYEHKEISELQINLYTKKQNLAIVLDEYGGVAGLVTSEDIVEKIFGELEDEYDNFESENIDTKNLQTPEKTMQISGDTKISKVAEILNINFSSDFYDTIAGFALEKLDAMPKENDFFEEQGFLFIIKEVLGNQIITIEINKIEDKND